MEQPDISAGAATNAIGALGRALSDEARASLESVRVAREAAQLRARRQTTHARIWFATGVGAAVVVGLAFGPRIARSRNARPPAATTAARPAPIAMPPAPMAPEARKPEPAEAPRPAVARPPVTAQAQAQAQARDVAVPDEGCDTGLIRKAPWRLSAQACARTFDADPRNGALALAIAHAEHAHGNAADAAQWAKRALSLNPDAAEAYVLIARADAAGGRHEDARASYRRYLELAPRGWHRTEARAALDR